MNKMYITLLCCFVLITAMLWLNGKQDSEAEVQKLLSKWDNGEITSEQKAKAIAELQRYWAKNPELTSEQVQQLSRFITVYEEDGFQLMEYIENPEIYGASARESYHIVLHQGVVQILDQKGSLRVDEMLKRDDNLYYIYATDYKMGALTGLRMFSIGIDEDQQLKLTSLIDKEPLDPEVVYDERSEILYAREGHIYVEDIKDRGAEVTLQAGASRLVLELGKEGRYTLSRNELNL